MAKRVIVPKPKHDREYLEKLAAAETRDRSLTAPRPTQARAPRAEPKIELDPSPGTRSVTEIADRMERVTKEGAAADRAVTAVRRQIRTAERTAGDGADIGGTGYTILKMRAKPVERLVTEGRIGQEELQAAEEITAAFMAVCSAVAIRPGSLERVDSCGGFGGPQSAQMAKRIKRFQQWAHHWSRRQILLADPMLEVVIAAVVDETPFTQIAAQVSRRCETVKYATICGLRDYAAHAGFVSGDRAQAWRNAAAIAFTAVHPKLAGAIRRARVEI